MLHRQAKTFLAETQRRLRPFAAGDVLREHDQSADRAVGFVPGLHFPLQPFRRPVGPGKKILIAPFHRARQDPLVDLLPPLREVRKHLVVGATDDVAIRQPIVGQPAFAGLQVAHLGVEHRDCRRRVTDELSEQRLALGQRLLAALLLRDVLVHAVGPDRAAGAVLHDREAHHHHAGRAVRADEAMLQLPRETRIRGRHGQADFGGHDRGILRRDKLAGVFRRRHLQSALLRRRRAVQLVEIIVEREAARRRVEFPVAQLRHVHGQHEADLVFAQRRLGGFASADVADRRHPDGALAAADALALGFRIEAAAVLAEQRMFAHRLVPVPDGLDRPRAELRAYQVQDFLADHLRSRS